MASGNPRRQLVEGLLQVGADHARTCVEPSEDVTIETKHWKWSEPAFLAGGKVIARGDDILFWEFGTGVNPSVDPGSHPLVADGTLDIKPGSYSLTHEQWLWYENLETFEGKWPYRNQWIEGQPPRKAMWGAAKAMREAIPDVVSEVSVFSRETGRGRPTDWSMPASGGAIKGMGAIMADLEAIKKFVTPRGG